jgi:hypothetical protein
MSKKYDLLKYGLAKEIVKDLPKLREILEKAKTDLSPYKKYRDAADLVKRIDESIIELDIHLQIYQLELKRKGKIE